MKKQNKWLDNFGKADNANESNVSMSDDFVGLSYDTSGRNYSPAWGGQFQTGGTLPGSPGFMYARTVNPAPSEGKYAKKTMPSAQNGQEMKFYQEGLDWKPKSMQDGGQQPLRVSTTDPEYRKLYENRQVGSWSPQYQAYNLPDLPEVTVTGEDESLKEAMYQGSNRFLQNALQISNAPQEKMMELITGKQQTPSQAWGFQNPGDWFDSPQSFGKNVGNLWLDTVVDPFTLTGGVGALGDVAGDIASYEARKLLKKGVFPFTYDADIVKNIPENIRRVNKGLAKKMPERFTKAVADVPKGFVLNMIRNREDALGTYLGLQKGGRNIKYSGVDDTTGFDKYTLSSHTPLNSTEARYISRKLQDNIKKIQSNKAIVEKDNIFHLMGGYSQFLSPDQKSIMYRDIWDLQPLKNVEEYKGVKLPKFIRNSEVSDFIPGAKPFVSEGKLGDIKTRYAQYPYKSIYARINDELDNFPIDALDLDDVENYEKFRKAAINNLKDEIIQNRGPITGFERPRYYPSERKVVDISPYFKVSKKKQGGVIKDNRGQWDHPGEITEIDSPYITMQGVPYSVLGVSDTGDTKLMEPGKDYKFKGKKVTEYPMAQKGLTVEKSNSDQSLYNTNDFIFSESELKDPIFKERINNCVSGNCLGDASTYFNTYVAPKLKSPNMWDIKDKYGITSGEDHPRINEYGTSADSWDIHGLLREKGAIANFTAPINSKNPFEKYVTDGELTKQQRDEYLKNLKLPVGSIISSGYNVNAKDAYNEKMGLESTNHSAIVVGYDESGVPIVAEFVGNKGSGIRRMDKMLYNSSISNITTPKEYKDFTFDKVGDAKDYSPLSLSINSKEYDDDEFIPFKKSLEKNKAKYANVFGLGDQEYNELARTASAIALTETRGGDDSTVRWKGIVPIPSYLTDKLGIGESTGITQLNESDIFKDERIGKKLKELGITEKNYDPWNPEHISAATIATLVYKKPYQRQLFEKKGNNKNLSEAEKDYYTYWNPSIPAKGQAYGDAENIKRFKKNYDLISFQKGGTVGINQLDAQPKKKLNQLLNFTNNPDKNWLDKYQ